MSNTIVSLSPELKLLATPEKQLELFTVRASKHFNAVKPEIWVERYLQAGFIILEPYINAQKTIKSLCLKCGYQSYKKPSNVQAGFTCNFCVGNAVYTSERVNEKLKSIYGPKCFLTEPFKDSVRLKHKIRYICGHTNNTTIDNLFRKKGCPICSKGGYKKMKTATLYYGHVENLSLWKIGITNRTFEKRYIQERNLEITPIYQWIGDGRIVQIVEKYVQNIFKPYQFQGLVPINRSKKSKAKKSREYFFDDISALNNWQKVLEFIDRGELKLL